MIKQKKKSSVCKFLMFICGAALTAVGFILILSLMEKCRSKMYKSSLKKEEIDFDSMGPEIVPHDKTKGE